MKHVMLDLETLGTTASAVILSIGAVRFDLVSDQIDDNAFYSSVSIESNLDLGRRIQEDTLIWWLKQEAAAQAVFHEPKTTLEAALTELSDWMGRDDSVVWSNGADFDLPMLAHAYSQVQIQTPWQHWNSRCFRTYKNLPGAKDIKVPFVGTKHNAMADALHQAMWLQAIHKTLFNTKAKV